MKRRILGVALITLILCGCGNRSSVEDNIVSNDSIDVNEAYALYENGVAKAEGLDNVLEQSEMRVHMQPENWDGESQTDKLINKSIKADIKKTNGENGTVAEIDVKSVDGNTTIEEKSFYNDGWAYYAENNTKKQVDFDERLKDFGAYDIEFDKSYILSASVEKNTVGSNIFMEIDTDRFPELIKGDLPFLEEYIDIYDDNTSFNYAQLEFDIDENGNIKGYTFAFEAKFQNDGSNTIFDVSIGKNYIQDNDIDIELPSDLDTYDNIGE